ncbi:probable E3 ubiquitin-protein ligase sinah [Periplaneta americana]|uniref:probable E3 ubiquitin-protein ligase sinah n=1 Tax=Periplaneta americana TaxID=6978 RepID=UPI0037E79E4A
MSEEKLRGLNSSLLTQLLCPRCSTSMAAPMYLCRRGHTVCGRCKGAPCPSCKEVVTETRNLFAEVIVSKVLYPCRHGRAGCKHMSLLVDLPRHVAACEYRNYPCLAGSGVGSVTPCGWHGRRALLADHVALAHKAHFSQKCERCVVYNNFSLAESSTSVTLISLEDGLFWWTKRRDASRRILVEAVQYLGALDVAAAFEYVHEFRSRSGDQTLSMTNRVRSDTEDVADRRRCLVLDAATVAAFVDDDGALVFSLSIRKFKE